MRNCPTKSTTRNTLTDKRELDGKPLVLDFAREFLPSDYDEVRHIFSRRGVYLRFKDLPVRRGVRRAYLADRPDGPRSFVSVTWACRGTVPSH